MDLWILLLGALVLSWWLTLWDLVGYALGILAVCYGYSGRLIAWCRLAVHAVLWCLVH